MRTCPSMQAYVEALVTRFVFDWSAPGTLCLFVEGHDYLVVENMGESRVRVANLLEIGPYWLADPMVVFYTAYRQHGRPAWIPIEVADMFVGWRLFAEPNPHDECLTVYDPVGQDLLARLCEEVYVANLIQFGWHLNGTQVSWPPQPRKRINFLEEALKYIDWSLVDEGEEDDGPQT